MCHLGLGLGLGLGHPRISARGSDGDTRKEAGVGRLICVLLAYLLGGSVLVLCAVCLCAVGTPYTTEYYPNFSTYFLPRKRRH